MTESDSAISVEFTIGEGHPCTSGHFPGMPIVPGAFLLTKVEDAIINAFPGKTISSLKKVKFLNILRPEELASVSLQPKTENLVIFSIESKGVQIASGRAVLASL